MKTYYKRKLPHITPLDGLFFITFRLAGTLPKEVIVKWQTEKTEAIKAVRKQFLAKPNYTGHHNYELAKQRQQLITNIQKRYFKQIDDYLDQATQGPTWLKLPSIAQIVANKIREYDGIYYRLFTYCIMSNHIHLLFDTSIQLTTEIITPDCKPLSKIMQYIKGASAYQANQILQRQGRFWQPESYDHLVRDEREFCNIVRYIANNPIKAGLKTHWYDWDFTYVHPDYQILL